MFELMTGVAYPVHNVEASHEFYSGKLGIRETFAGDGKTWAALRVVRRRSCWSRQANLELSLDTAPASCLP